MLNEHIQNICDEYLRTLEKVKFMTPYGWYHSIIKDASEYETKSATKQLEIDGFITSDRSGSYTLTPSGTSFYYNGGYKKRRELIAEKEATIENLNKSVIDANQSVIATNISTEKAYESQKWTGWASVIVAIAAVIIASIQLFKDDGSEQMKTLIQQQNQKFDSMVKVQQQIEQHLSRITKDTLHLPVQLPSIKVDKNLPKAR